MPKMRVDEVLTQSSEQKYRLAKLFISASMALAFSVDLHLESKE